MLTPVHNNFAPAQDAKSKTQGIAATARAFEAMIVSQMLQASGINKPPDGFGGGTGEDQFASFMTDAQAQAFVATGGIGLSERLIRAMSQNGAT